MSTEANMASKLNPDVTLGRVNVYLLALAFSGIVIANLWPHVKMTGYYRDEEKHLPHYEYTHKFGWPAIFVSSIAPEKADSIFEITNPQFHFDALVVNVIVGIVLAVVSAKIAEIIFIWFPSFFQSLYRSNESDNAHPVKRPSLAESSKAEFGSLFALAAGALFGFLIGRTMFLFFERVAITHPPESWQGVAWYVGFVVGHIVFPIVSAFQVRRLSNLE